MIGDFVEKMTYCAWGWLFDFDNTILRAVFLPFAFCSLLLLALPIMFLGILSMIVEVEDYYL